MAEREESEIGVLQEFLPAQLGDDEIKAIVESIIAEPGAVDIKGMGKVMGALKGKYAGQLDMGKAGGIVKSLLG